MATEPIPEPLTHQEVNPEREAAFPDPKLSRPELVNQAAPPLVPDRELPRAPRVEELKQSASQKLDNMKDAAMRAAKNVQKSTSRAVDRTREEAASAYSQTRERLASAYDETSAKAADALEQARRRALYYMDEYPLQVIAGVAGTAFLLGVFLRIWRSNRDA
jgi:ElaB/YqjD/DUF883 family membrane-anchored ribosome-binding protein